MEVVGEYQKQDVEPVVHGVGAAAERISYYLEWDCKLLEERGAVNW